jgi:hypothetical protein
MQTDVRVSSVNTGNTGVSASIEDTTYTGKYCIYYLGHGEDFTDISNWTDELTLYSIYKGMIEYAISTYPDATVCFMQPWAASVDFSSTQYKNLDGSWSQDKWKDSDYNLSLMAAFEAQAKVCDFYNIQCIEVFKNEGMSIMNVETYFYSNNVHPKNIGYYKHGTVAYELINK